MVNSQVDLSIVTVILRAPNRGTIKQAYFGLKFSHLIKRILNSEGACIRLGLTAFTSEGCHYALKVYLMQRYL